MSDFISRQAAIEALDFKTVHMTGVSNDEKNITNPFAQYNKGLEDGIKAIRDLPSAEPERTAKVETVEKPNVFKCSECGQYFHSTAWGSPVKYCSRCGCRLIWGEDISMEYFESGGR